MRVEGHLFLTSTILQLLCFVAQALDNALAALETGMSYAPEAVESALEEVEAGLLYLSDILAIGADLDLGNPQKHRRVIYKCSKRNLQYLIQRAGLSCIGGSTGWIGIPLRHPSLRLGVKTLRPFRFG